MKASSHGDGGVSVGSCVGETNGVDVGTAVCVAVDAVSNTAGAKSCPAGVGVSVPGGGGAVGVSVIAVGGALVGRTAVGVDEPYGDGGVGDGVTVTTPNVNTGS